MLKNILRLWLPHDASADRVPNSGAVPYAIIDGRLAVLLITSRRSGRWIFPKGAILAGKSAWESARIEALEEAGIEGQIDPDPLGSYLTTGNDARRSVIEVKLYGLCVEHQHDTWREKDQRYRHWATLPEARRLVADKRLGEVLTTLKNRVLPKT